MGASDDELFEEMLAARRQRLPCALVTVAATTGSVPREAGSKMLVYGSGKISGTIGGGKFEALVIEESRTRLREKKPLLKTYPLREGEEDSFGAICGGEVTVLIEPQAAGEAIFLVGAGHCSRAIARLARECGLNVTVIEDRAEALEHFTDAHAKLCCAATDFISSREWQPDEALVLANRNFEMDQQALLAAVQQPQIGYVGMIGSRRKVLRVFDELKKQGVPDEVLARVHAPMGLDIGADSPAEIAVSVIAEILQVLRNRSGAPLRLNRER